MCLSEARPCPKPHLPIQPLRQALLGHVAVQYADRVCGQPLLPACLQLSCVPNVWTTSSGITDLWRTSSNLWPSRVNYINKKMKQAPGSELPKETCQILNDQAGAAYLVRWGNAADVPSGIPLWTWRLSGQGKRPTACFTTSLFVTFLKYIQTQN